MSENRFYIQGYFNFQTVEAEKAFAALFGHLSAFSGLDGIYDSILIPRKEFFKLFRYSEGDAGTLSTVALKSDPYVNIPREEFIFN
jgi:hypothetical protein